ncbi:hypothetical protein EJ05DRAFT_504775 [Pseudovirgaria hyperparasitica]|uniref:Uncharacterized protein n=1 Tax=Pseudovirgaria hyperparasitica TaxID=470096 RepID=A0A6A6VVM2_9PEZI|nr:uncharacterized protein EJ05DRAFT_504775 [Pseudovirgaria hyperparasitica]KAF2753680.1 hypothetical protein EJ05DRAFT_504775 [Pseudovirgaria hyperparasitica]
MAPALRTTRVIKEMPSVFQPFILGSSLNKIELLSCEYVLLGIVYFKAATGIKQYFGQSPFSVPDASPRDQTLPSEPLIGQFDGANDKGKEPAKEDDEDPPLPKTSFDIHVDDCDFEEWARAGGNYDEEVRKRKAFQSSSNGMQSSRMESSAAGDDAPEPIEAGAAGAAFAARLTFPVRSMDQNEDTPGTEQSDTEADWETTDDSESDEAPDYDENEDVENDTQGFEAEDLENLPRPDNDEDRLPLQALNLPVHQMDDEYDTPGPSSRHHESEESWMNRRARSGLWYHRDEQ